MYHFGSLEKSIPVSDTDRIKAAYPDGALYFCEGADHGFNCEQRSSYNAEAAALARQRTLGRPPATLPASRKNDEASDEHETDRQQPVADAGLHRRQVGERHGGGTRDS